MKLDTDKTIVPNWFDKEHIEDMIGRKISDKKYNTIKENINNSDIPDTISQIIKDYINDFYK